MNLPALGGVDPGDMTPDERVAAYALIVIAHNVGRHSIRNDVAALELVTEFQRRLDNVFIRTGYEEDRNA